MQQLITFAELRRANRERLPLFKNKNGQPYHIGERDGGEWSISQWINATLGEVSEATDVLLLIAAISGSLGKAGHIAKKLDRLDLQLNEPTRLALANELADVVIYLDIAALRAGIDLGAAVANKFNEVSQNIGCDVYIAHMRVAAWIRGVKQHTDAGFEYDEEIAPGELPPNYAENDWMPLVHQLQLSQRPRDLSLPSHFTQDEVREILNSMSAFAIAAQVNERAGNAERAQALNDRLQQMMTNGFTFEVIKDASGNAQGIYQKDLGAIAPLNLTLADALSDAGHHAIESTDDFTAGEVSGLGYARAGMSELTQVSRQPHMVPSSEEGVPIAVAPDAPGGFLDLGEIEELLRYKCILDLLAGYHYNSAAAADAQDVPHCVKYHEGRAKLMEERCAAIPMLWDKSRVVMREGMYRHEAIALMKQHLGNEPLNVVEYEARIVNAILQAANGTATLPERQPIGWMVPSHDPEDKRPLVIAWQAELPQAVPDQNDWVPLYAD